MRARKDCTHNVKNRIILGHPETSSFSPSLPETYGKSYQAKTELLSYLFRGVLLTPRPRGNYASVIPCIFEGMDDIDDQGEPPKLRTADIKESEIMPGPMMGTEAQIISDRTNVTKRHLCQALPECKFETESSLSFP